MNTAKYKSRNMVNAAKNDKSPLKSINTSNQYTYTRYNHQQGQTNNSPLNKSSQGKNLIPNQISLSQQLQKYTAINDKNNNNNNAHQNSSSILKKKEINTHCMINAISMKQLNAKVHDNDDAEQDNLQNLNNFHDHENLFQLNMDISTTNLDPSPSSKQSNYCLLRPTNLQNKNTALVDKSYQKNHNTLKNNPQTTKPISNPAFGFLTKDTAKENFNTITPMGHLGARDSGNVGDCPEFNGFTKKSHENANQVLLKQLHDLANRQDHTQGLNNYSLPSKRLLNDPSDSNITPVKNIGYPTPNTTGLNLHQENNLARTSSNFGTPWKGFKANEDVLSNPKNHSEVNILDELSPIKPHKLNTDCGYSYVQNGNSTSGFCAQGLELKDKDYLLKERKNIINQSNSKLIKQINFLGASTPTSYSKTPIQFGLSSLTPTQKTQDQSFNTNLELVKKDIPSLNIQTTKEQKKFEFPVYLSNNTCDPKKKIQESFNDQVLTLAPAQLCNQAHIKENNYKRVCRDTGDNSDPGDRTFYTEQNQDEINSFDQIKPFAVLKTSPNKVAHDLKPMIPESITTKPIKVNYQPNSFKPDMNGANIPKFDKTPLCNHKENQEYSFKEFNYETSPNRDKSNNNNNNGVASSKKNPGTTNNILPNSNVNSSNKGTKKDSRKESHDKEEVSQNASNSKEIVMILDQDPSEMEIRIANFKQNYKVYQQIGQGAYATVRLAIHKPTGTKIAIKIYEKSKILDPMRRKSVIREIKLMQKLDHPNIIKIHDILESRNHVNIIMEYIGGGSLHGLLKSQPTRRLKEEEAYKLFKQVLSGISYCHNRWITHRDIKLENLLLDEHGTIKIIDFGFSTCLPNDKKVKMFCGTPSYMAPEIILKKEYYGPPVDIWALGVLLYVLLCGTFPFKGLTDKELYTKILKGEITLPEYVSEMASTFIKKMLNVDADKRPNASDLFNDSWMIYHAKLEKKDTIDNQQPIKPKIIPNDKSFLEKYQPVTIEDLNFTTLNASGTACRQDPNSPQIGNKFPNMFYLKQQQNTTPTNGNTKFFNTSEYDNHRSSIKNLLSNITILKDGNSIHNKAQISQFGPYKKNPQMNVNDTNSNNNTSGVGNGHLGNISGGFGVNCTTNTTENAIDIAEEIDIVLEKYKTSKNSTNHAAAGYYQKMTDSPSIINYSAIEIKTPTRNTDSRRPSINTNPFFGISHTTNKKDNYMDSEIINKLVMLGYNEDDIIQSIREKNGLLYKLYLKAMQEKRLGNSSNTTSSKNLNICENAAVPIHNPFNQIHIAPSHLRPHYQEINGYATPHAKNSQYCDMSATKTKDLSLLDLEKERNQNIFKK